MRDRTVWVALWATTREPQLTFTLTYVVAESAELAPSDVAGYDQRVRQTATQTVETLRKAAVTPSTSA